MYALPRYTPQQRVESVQGPPGEMFVVQLRAYLDHARRSDKSFCAEITVDSRPLLLIDAYSDLAIIPTTLQSATEELAIAMAGRSSALAVTQVGAEQFQEAAARFRAVAMMPLLWASALQAYCGRGAIPPLNGGSRLMITRLPKRAVLAGNHDHFRVCAVLFNRAVTATQCASALDIHRAQVQLVFNAAYLTGHASRGGRAVQVMQQDAPQGKRHLASERLQLLWRHLRAAG